jgi:hypothetical protein
MTPRARAGAVDMMNGRQWSGGARQRCFALWCGRGNRNASRTVALYREEHSGVGPAVATVRRWAAQEDWQSWAGEHPPPIRSTDVNQWMTMWRRHVARQIDAALRIQTDVFLGKFDDDPATGAASLTTAAASLQQILTQPGVRALLRFGPSGVEASPISLAKRERQARERLRQRRIRH